MANIQIKRYNGSAWDELYPRTKISNLFETINNQDYSLTENNKIRERFLPDYLLGQMVYAGIIVTEKNDSTVTGYDSANYKQGLWGFADTGFTKVIVNLTDAGKAKIIANNSGSTITWNSTYPNKAILYYSSTQGADPDPQSTLSYPAFDFRECTDCYFIFQNPHGHTAGESYGLFADIASEQHLVGPFLNDVVAGDWIVATASGWGKIDNTDAVISVNGHRGTVTLDADNIYMSGSSGTTISGKFSEKASLSGANFTGNVSLADSKTLTIVSFKNTSKNFNGFVRADKGTGTLYIDYKKYAEEEHAHVIADIVGDNNEVPESGYFVAVNQGSSSNGEQSEWADFSDLPVVGADNSDRNGLMPYTAKITLDNLQTLSSDNPSSANTGDIYFQQI